MAAHSENPALQDAQPVEHDKGTQLGAGDGRTKGEGETNTRTSGEALPGGSAHSESSIASGTSGATRIRSGGKRQAVGH